MFDPLLADDLASGAGNKLAVFAIKCLAVGGGFLVGYFLGGLIAWALDRWVFAHKAPAQLKKAVSFLAGLALAIIVALIVFGDGGGGLGGGRGNPGDGKGATNPDEKGKSESNPPVVPKKDQKTEPKIIEPEPPPPPSDAIINVTILGGADVPNNDQRYYLVAGDSNRKDLKGLEEIIIRKQQTKGMLAIVVQYREKNRPPENPEADSITDLRALARKLNLSITFPRPRPSAGGPG